jgi:hypothetical protein
MYVIHAYPECRDLQHRAVGPDVLAVSRALPGWPIRKSIVMGFLSLQSNIRVSSSQQAKPSDHALDLVPFKLRLEYSACNVEGKENIAPSKDGGGPLVAGPGLIPCQVMCDLCKRPWRTIGLWEVKAPTFSRQSAHRWRWDCQPYAPAAIYPPRKISGTHFC